jgi:hypothetical protein
VGWGIFGGSFSLSPGLHAWSYADLSTVSSNASLALFLYSATIKCIMLEGRHADGGSSYKDWKEFGQ